MEDYGIRPDGTPKGSGFLGPLKSRDGRIMTEYSVGVPILGKEMDIPTLVPTLSEEEINQILNLKEGEVPSDAIIYKAAKFAEQRIKQGLPVFAAQQGGTMDQEELLQAFQVARDSGDTENAARFAAMLEQTDPYVNRMSQDASAENPKSIRDLGDPKSALLQNVQDAKRRNTLLRQGGQEALAREDYVKSLPNFNSRDLIAAVTTAGAIPATAALAAANPPLAGAAAIGMPMIASKLRDLANSPEGEQLRQKSKDVPLIGGILNSVLSPDDSKFAINAGRTTDKLIEGTKDIIDVSKLAAGMYPPVMSEADRKAGINSMVNRRKDQMDKDAMFKAFEGNYGPGGIAGGALPYLLSGYAGEKLARPTVSKIAEAISSAPKAAASQAKGVFSRGIERSATSSNPIAKSLGNLFKTQITDPWATRATKLAAQTKDINPYTEGMLSEFLTSTLTGAAEGAAHFDNSMGEGALAGSIGAIPGMAVRPYLSKMPDFYKNKPAIKADIEWAEKKGWRFPWGAKTGSHNLQIFDSGITNNKDFADTMRYFDDNNSVVTSRLAAKAMGIGGKKLPDELSPTVLRNHVTDLKTRYQDIESRTLARFDPKDFLELSNHVKELAKNKTKEGKAIASDAKNYLLMMEQEAKVRRGPMGRMMPRTIDGPAMKEIRASLKADISKSYKDGNPYRAKKLEPIMKKINSGIDRGLGGPGSPATVAEYRDLDEKYGITKMVMEHAMDPIYGLDTTKLKNHLMATDAERLLTETGSERLVTLQKLAKIDAFTKEHKGGNLTGIGLKSYGNKGTQSIVQKLMLTPAAGYLPTPTRTMLALYKKYGWPRVTGLLGLSGKDFGNPALYSRALHQSGQYYPQASEFVSEKYNTGKEKAKKLKDFLLE